jgi:hypothetical protein
LKKIYIVFLVIFIGFAIGAIAFLRNGQTSPVEKSVTSINSTKGEILKFVIEPSISKPRWTVYGSGAVAKVIAKNVKSVELKYEPVITESVRPKMPGEAMPEENEFLPNGSLGQMISLSSNQFAWVLPMPTASTSEGFISPHVWVEAVGLDDAVIKGPDIGGVMYQNLVSAEQALKKVSSLPDVKAYMMRVKAGGGDPHVGVKDAWDMSNEGIYSWFVTVYESFPDRNVNYAFYHVEVETGKIDKISNY